MRFWPNRHENCNALVDPRKSTNSKFSFEQQISHFFDNSNHYHFKLIEYYIGTEGTFHKTLSQNRIIRTSNAKTIFKCNIVLPQAAFLEWRRHLSTFVFVQLSANCQPANHSNVYQTPRYFANIQIHKYTWQVLAPQSTVEIEIRPAMA